VTANELARSYLAKATVRLEMLSFLLEREAWSDVVREAQELVELALKAMLRQVGVDPPKWHDVGPILLEEAELFPAALRPPLPRLADMSKRLRKEREFAFYGDIGHPDARIQAGGCRASHRRGSRSPRRRQVADRAPHP
jgi:HEPN domain-containing protein